MDKLTTPSILKKNIFLEKDSIDQINNDREIIKNILNDKDKRLLVIIGPCSIHNTIAALEYAKHLKGLSDKYADKIFFVMRTYFEKPRTSIGWKGFINDPFINETYKINIGLILGRKLMLNIIKIGLPVAYEFLNLNTANYFEDLVSFGVVGARTSESQGHREMISNMSMPCFFKNSTDGDIQTAIDAIKVSKTKQTFVGIDSDNQANIITSQGNQDTHIILRGGKKGPNYEKKYLDQFANKLTEEKLIIDCSHGNSEKNHLNQAKVAYYTVDQMVAGNKFIKGIMIESNIKEGKQKISDNMKYGISITDSCISIEQTEEIIKNIYAKL